MNRKTLSIVLSLVVVGVASVFIFGRISLFSKIFNTPLPSALPYDEPRTATPNPKPTTSVVVSAKEVNLDIPFTSQAPHLNWDQPYQDFCEEASILMAVQYVHGEPIPNTDFADA